MAAALTAPVLAVLTQTLVAACPGVTGTDGSTIWYKDGTIPGCQSAAQAALASFNPTTAVLPAPLATAAFIGRFTAAERAALWKSAQTDPTIGADLILIQSSPTVDLTSPVVTNWVNALTAANVLTPARSTVVMTPPAQAKAGP